MQARPIALAGGRLLRLTITLMLLLGLLGSFVPAEPVVADEATPEATAEVTPAPDTPVPDAVTPEPTVEVETPTPEPTAVLTATPEPTAPPPEPTATATEVTPAAETPVVETPVAEPSPTATPTRAAPTPAAAVSATATATATATAKATVAAPVVAAATYVITIRPKDANGVALPNVCFEVRRDAGGKTIGSRIRTICDDAGVGKLTTSLGDGSFVLVETQHPNTVGTALPKFFTVTGTRSVTVNHQWLINVVITSKDRQTGEVLKDGCYIVAPVGSPYGGEACDAYDGVSDGVTTIGGIDRGTWEVRSTYASPDGYLPAPTRTITITSLSAPFAMTMRHTEGATLVVTKQDQNEQAVKGACLELWTDAGGGTRGQFAIQICDNFDQVEDGTLTFKAIPTGAYVLHESNAPEGYLVGPDQPVALTNGQTTEVTLVNRLGGTVILQTVDDLGNPINDSCVFVFADAGGGAHGQQIYLPCKKGPSETDGESRVIGFPAGDWVLAQYSPQPGYLHAPEQRVTIAEGETTTIQLVSPLGGVLNVHRLDDHGNPLPGECVRVVEDAGGGTPGPTVVDMVCDNWDGQADGVTHIGGLPPRNLLLVDLLWQLPYSPSADIPFSVGVRQTLDLNLVNVEHGTLRIVRKNPEGEALLGGCVDVVWAPGTPKEGQQVVWDACDGPREPADGSLTLRIPNGRFEVHDSGYLDGFAHFAPFTVEIADSGLVEVTVTNDRLPRLSITTVDAWGDVVKGVCLALVPDTESGNTSYEQAECDGYGSDADGAIGFHLPIQPGRWFLRSTGNSSYPFDEITLDLALNEVRALEVVVVMPAPTITVGPFLMDVTDTGFTLYFTTDQKTVSTVTYGTGGVQDRSGPSTAETPTIAHRVRIGGLQPATIYDWTLTTGNDYGEAVVDGWTFRTAPSNAKIVVKKVTSTGTTLKGACFDLYVDAGGGALGDSVGYECDDWESDGSNGVTTFGGLLPGNYVVVEAFAPAKYKLAAPVRVTLDPGKTKRITVTDYRGGTVLKIRNEIYGYELLEGACFSVYKRGPGETLGAFVTWGCDAFDGEDSTTTISGLANGEYVLVQYYVPEGFVLAERQLFSVYSGLNGLLNLTVVNHRVGGEQVVSVKSVDAAGNLLTGACYAFYHSAGGTALGDWLGDECDGSDGRMDGYTNIVLDGVSGRLVVLEYIAPKGYVAGTKVAVTKAYATGKTVRVVQAPGGVAVRVTTLKGDSSTKLPGACYGLYRQVGSVWEFVTFACDGWDGANDGVVRIVGVPAGTYRLYQTTTPGGYTRPGYKAVTVGTTTKSVTVRTYPS